jgi:uncharacterized protein YggE
MQSKPLKIITVVGSICMVMLLAAGLVLLANTPSPAQAQTGDEMASPLPRTITVVGTGSVSAEPDVAEANIGVEISRPTVDEATQEAGTRMAAVMAAIQAAGVATDDIQTSGYNLYVERPSELQAQTAVSETYRVSNNVRVTIRDLDAVGTVLDAAINAGANNIYGVNFQLHETAALESEARAQAIADAQATAKELASLAGVEVGQVISISDVIGGPTGPQFEAASTARGIGGAGPISPGSLDVQVQLQVVYALN